MSAHTIVIARRFRGPAGSGNGGYTAGLLARLLTGSLPASSPVTVMLRRPPPLDRPLEVRDGSTHGTADTDTLELVDGSDVVASATVGAFTGQPVDAVSLGAAGQAESSYRGLHDHPFPGCFVCGIDREPGDGLLLRPGATAPGRTACVWRPDPSLADPQHAGLAAPEFVWAALDCPGGWTSDLEARPLVLGRMTAACASRPHLGRDHVVVGTLLGEQGRKIATATALYDEQGSLLARAEQVWIAVDPATFGG